MKDVIGLQLHAASTYRQKMLTVALLFMLLVQPLTGLAAPVQRPIHENLTFGTPVLLAPDDNALTTGLNYPPLGVPTLTWRAVNGAEKYRVEISKSSGFASIDVKADTFSTTYTPIAALADGIYYWRVSAGAGTTWGSPSESRAFTKSWNDNGNYIPQLIAPSIDTQRLTFTTEDFTWSPFLGAARYKFEIGTDATFSNVVYSALTIKAQHTPTKRLPNNFYYWRVTPIDNAKNFGQPSDTWPFRFNWNVAPQLLSPAHNVDLAFLPRFSWTAVEAAGKYELQISTQPDFGSANIYQTTNTEYTPEKNLSNDQDYYWRVKAIDLQSNSTAWSDVRQFRIRWNFRTEQLVPVNNTIKQSNPFFAWTPIPGAERYQIQVDESNSYDKPLMDEVFYNVPTSAIVKIEDGTIWIDRDYFWRVRGLDAQGNFTPWSNNNSFRYGYETSPNLVYPLPYFTPDSVNTPIHSDRTIAWPMFIWDNASSYGTEENKPDYYELTVAADPFFNDISFQVETTGLFAAPTLDNPFFDSENTQIYYWRVRAYFSSGRQLGVDHVWKTRIDLTMPKSPSSTVLTPIYPRDRFEAVGTAPMLGWLPISTPDVNHYRVQVSTDANFTETDIVDEALAQFPNYAPWQGRRDPMPFDTYFWRVRAEDAGSQPLSEWGETRHFHLSQEVMVGNVYDFIPPVAPNSLLTVTKNYTTEFTYVASSVVTDQEDYEIDKLHVMLNRIDLRDVPNYPRADGNPNWIFAFAVSPYVNNLVNYSLYIDIDHVVGSGGTVDPLGKPIVTDSLYLPEYVFVLERGDNNLDAADVKMYTWHDTAWGPGELLSNKGGDAWFDGAKSAVQILVPVTTISTSEESNDEFAGSLAIALVRSNDNSQTGILDSIPPQSGNSVTNVALVSDMLMPLYPLDTPLSNPMVHYDVPPMRWRLPYGSSNDGYEVQVARDVKFTDIVFNWELTESGTDPFYSFLTTTFQPSNAFEDNESYYWRVRLRHERYANNSSLFDYGIWSPAMRFKLDSRQVGNPQLSTGNLAETTPSFWWDRVEGASGYTIQVDDDANFSNPILINKKIDGISFTPITPLPDGVYYWRVAVRRSSTVLGHWTPTMTFTKQSLTPTLLAPINGEIVNQQPTFSWTAILTPTVQPRVAAAIYRLEISADPNFGTAEKFLTESTTFTLPDGKSLADGTWYWRVTVMIDNNTVGAYSASQQFYKEYLTPTLLTPDQNSVITSTTSFAWAPIVGAAKYEILIDDEPLFNNPIKVTATTDSTKYTPTQALANAQYYWRVRMLDEDGKPGPFANGLVRVQDVAFSLGNYVWIDADNNGNNESGEKPVPDGVVLELLNGAGVSLNTTTQTARGFYLFDNLMAGDYRIRLAASNFATGGPLQNYRHSTGPFQEAEPNGNVDSTDNGLDGSNPATEGITSGLITLGIDEPLGETPTASRTAGDDGSGTPDANSNLTIDFAVLSPPPTAIAYTHFIYLPVVTK